MAETIAQNQVLAAKRWMEHLKGRPHATMVTPATSVRFTIMSASSVPACLDHHVHISPTRADHGRFSGRHAVRMEAGPPGTLMEALRVSVLPSNSNTSICFSTMH